MIYLDNAATTKQISPRLDDIFFNPSANYSYSEKQLLETERAEIASLLGAKSSEIYFTPSATIANNIAILGQKRLKNFTAVSTLAEHQSVYAPLMYLNNTGSTIKLSQINKEGGVDASKFIDSCKDANFISLIHQSNETGTKNDIESIVRAIRKKNKTAIIHSDGAASFCKEDIDVKKLGVDLYTISGHKVGAGLGVAALFIKSGVNISPIFFGGGQENGLCSGTENLTSILAFSKNAKQYKQAYKNCDFSKLKKPFLSIENTQWIENSSNILCLSIENVRGEILQRILAKCDEVFIGLGSACAKQNSKNRVLQAMGFSKKRMQESIRISLSPFNTQEECIIAAEKIAKRVGEIRGGQIG